MAIFVYIHIHDLRRIIYSYTLCFFFSFLFFFVVGAFFTEGERHVRTKINLDLVKFLIQNGANVNAVDELGRTPLHMLDTRSNLKIQFNTSSTIK